MTDKDDNSSEAMTRSVHIGSILASRDMVEKADKNGFIVPNKKK